MFADYLPCAESSVGGGVSGIRNKSVRHSPLLKKLTIGFGRQA